MASLHPYYRKRLPSARQERDFDSTGTVVDLTRAHLPESARDKVALSRSRFDDRAAAVMRAAAGIDGGGGDGPPRIFPTVLLTYVLVPTEGEVVHFDRVPRDEPRFGGHEHLFEARDLLEMKWYANEAPTIHVPRAKCLALLAYQDHFPANPRIGRGLRAMVSRALLAASPGWCGTFGPGVDGAFSLEASEGNYDMSQMHLLPMAYRHYDDLSPAARERLIRQLLAQGRVHRPRRGETFTHGGNPDDWSRAGFVSPGSYHVDIGETENHVLMIQTARYLTNQLMHPREGGDRYDNRRNDGDGPSCFSLLLSLLRNMLRGDFSEYNAKNYQSETRWALLNLCTYAYDHEVRLGARMVLDYISAHMAVSTNDLRRLVPFRRRVTDATVAHTSNGFMTVGLMAYVAGDARDNGADPSGPYFAVQAGNVRGYEMPHPTAPAPYGIADGSTDLAMEVLSDYRIPPLVLDLFVTDPHRRFYQRLHRTRRGDEVGGNRNCDNHEIYASSPSYLITAGGAPALWAINPAILAVIDGDSVYQQVGIAVTTTFMPTGLRENRAGGLIQFGAFSRKLKTVTHFEFLGFDVAETNTAVPQSVANYGVAPDFACGPQVWVPWWLDRHISEGVTDGVPVNPRETAGWSFVNMGRTGSRDEYAPGFYLAIYQETAGLLALMEAFDTWLHPGVSFVEFKAGVLERNRGIRLFGNVPAQYTTHNGNRIDFVIWNRGERLGAVSGSEVLGIHYGSGDPVDAQGHAERAGTQLLNGTILNSPQEGMVVITNPALGKTLTLDFSDPRHPRRSDTQTGESEVAGFNNEVWLDFDHGGRTEGDVCRPINTLGAALAAVADGGVVRIVPGATEERGTIGGGKRFTLVAPIGGVSIGVAHARRVIVADLLEGVSNRDVWIEFDWPNVGDEPFLFNRLEMAMRSVADGGVINIQPGTTSERLTIGAGKRFTLNAPIGGVTLGQR